MDDKTIVKPRPGKRTGSSVKPANNNDNALNTVVSEVAPQQRYDNVILSISENPLVDCAGTLLSIGVKLRTMKQYDDVLTLKKQSTYLIKEFEQQLRSKQITPDTINSARYCLCSFIDEIVLNTTWGGNSVWASESLLSTFYKETFGGEYFYTLLDSALAQPAQEHQLLELMYLCITLGFVGKMRVEPQGDARLEELREKLFLAVQSQKSNFHRELSPNWSQNVVTDVEFQQPFPMWVIGAISSVMLLFVYMAFSYNINNYSSTTYKELISLVPWKQVNPNDQQVISRDEGMMLARLLATEIDKQLLEIEQQSDRIRIRIGAGVLFSSGNTQPRSDFEAILAKIARTLESTQGKILITGHTDNEPIFTTKYPSNWHLSLARATAIGNFLANNASLSGRLWPEGRGEAEPRYPNDSNENRALNRRIEIDLLF